MLVKRTAKIIPDSQIDFSDIPEFTDSQRRQMKRPGRPLLGSPRTLIAIRVENDILERLKNRAKLRRLGYQTLINEVLGKYVQRKKAA